MEKPVSFFNYAQHVHRPPPHIEMMQVNSALAAQNDAIYRRHWSFNNLPLQQLRFASREDAILRDELRQTRKRLTQMERRIEEFEGQLHPHRNRQPHGPRRPFDAMRPQTIPETSAEPDLTSWLTQQRQNCELWNQNFALKECLRNIEVENNMLREMCRQKEVNISLLENKTRQLKSDLQFYSDMKHDTKELVQAFNFKPLKCTLLNSSLEDGQRGIRQGKCAEKSVESGEADEKGRQKEEEVGSYKCTCGQC